MQEDKGAIEALLEKSKTKIAEVAAEWFRADRVIRLILAARSQNPQLRECSKESVLLFFMKMAETGLESIGPGGAWPVPFRNKATGQKEIQFIPDYRGLIWLAKKTGNVKSIEAQCVFKNDEIKITLGDTPSVAHVPAIADRGELVGAYCVVIDQDGSRHVEYMTREEIEKVRSASKAADTGPWKDWHERMALKTVIRRALNQYAGTHRSIGAAIRYDEEIKLSGDEKDSAQGEPDETNESQAELPATQDEPKSAELF